MAAQVHGFQTEVTKLLGLLAKGDQNCYTPAEDTRSQDIFGMGEATSAPEPPSEGALVRDPNSLPPGVVQTAAEKAAAEKAAAAEAQRKAEEAEAVRLAEEARLAEEEKKNAKPGFGTKIMKWLSSIAAPDE